MEKGVNFPLFEVWKQYNSFAAKMLIARVVAETRIIWAMSVFVKVAKKRGTFTIKDITGGSIANPTIVKGFATGL